MGNQPKSGRGGRREGAGRPKGALTAKTRAIAEQAIERGVTPLEVMLEAMTRLKEEGDMIEAAKVASLAAPYVHPRLSSVESTVKADVTTRGATVDRPVQETREQWIARRQRELTSMVPSTGPAN